METFLGISIFDPGIQKVVELSCFLTKILETHLLGFPVLTGNSGAVWSDCQGQREIPAPSRRLALNHIYSSINKGHVKLLNNLVCVGLRLLVIKVPVLILRCSGHMGGASLPEMETF